MNTLLSLPVPTVYQSSYKYPSPFIHISAVNTLPCLFPATLEKKKNHLLWVSLIILKAYTKTFGKIWLSANDEQNTSALPHHHWKTLSDGVGRQCPGRRGCSPRTITPFITKHFPSFIRYKFLAEILHNYEQATINQELPDFKSVHTKKERVWNHPYPRISWSK